MTEEKKVNNELISLSPSKLSVLVECPRCFWLQMNAKIKRPRGPFPSLPGGIDRKLKPYFDMYRAKGQMPPEFEGKLPGVLFHDQALLSRWRNWRSGLYYRDEVLNVEMVTALDDLLVLVEDDPDSDVGKKNVYVPFDYKTKGGVPKTNGAEFYQTQLNCYELALKANGYDTCGKGVLAYVYPEDLERIDDMVRRVVPFDFGVDVYELPTSIDDAKALIERACTVLRGPAPASNAGCEYCKYAFEYAEFEEADNDDR